MNFSKILLQTESESMSDEQMLRHFKGSMGQWHSKKKTKQNILQRENERVFVVRDGNSDAFKNQTEMSIIKWNSNVKCGRAR